MRNNSAMSFCWKKLIADSVSSGFTFLSTESRMMDIALIASSILVVSPVKDSLWTLEAATNLAGTTSALNSE